MSLIKSVILGILATVTLIGIIGILTTPVIPQDQYCETGTGIVYVLLIAVALALTLYLAQDVQAMKK